MTDKVLVERAYSCKSSEWEQLVEWYHSFLDETWGDLRLTNFMHEDLFSGEEAILNAHFHGNLEQRGAYDVAFVDDDTIKREQAPLPETHPFNQRKLEVLYRQYKDRVEVLVTQEGPGVSKEKFFGIMNGDVVRKREGYGHHCGIGLLMLPWHFGDFKWENEGKTITLIKYFPQAERKTFCKNRNYEQLQSRVERFIREEVPDNTASSNLFDAFLLALSNARVRGNLEVPGIYEVGDDKIMTEEDIKARFPPGHKFNERKIWVALKRYSVKVDLTITNEGREIDFYFFNDIKSGRAKSKYPGREGGLRKISSLVDKMWQETNGVTLVKYLKT